MKTSDLNRRQFLRILVSVLVTFAIGCDREQLKTVIDTPLLSPEESLKKLILLLGPWPDKDREKAEDFAGRFLKAGHTVDPYLPESDNLVQSLASRFPADAMSMREINLQGLPEKEKELLMNLVSQLHGFVEVRFYISHEPPWGECQGDRTGYTKAPGSGTT